MRSASRVGASVVVLVLLALAGRGGAQGASVIEPLDYTEVITGGASATDPLPMVVMLHGRGDDPARWQHLMAAQVPEPARMILVRAPLRLGAGFEWFDYAGGSAPLGPVVRPMTVAASRVLATIDRLVAARPTLGRPIVTGFSQGAMLTYALAVLFPDRFAAAYPAAGFLLPRLALVVPERGARLPPIVAFHGGRDRVIPIEADRRTVQVLRARGFDAELREAPDVGHTLDGLVGLMTEVRAALERERAN